MNFLKSAAVLAALLAGQAMATPVQWNSGTGANGHWYEVVTSRGVTGAPQDIGWNDSRSNALASAYAGLNGYLATVTSAEENSFITGISGGGLAWLGGTDRVVEGDWRWIDGPEAGNAFTYGAWAGGEPNNYLNEDYVVINWGLGRWNDLAPGGVDYYQGVTNYVVEYSGNPNRVPEPSTLALVGMVLSSMALVARRKR